jgi:hypothetical protein
MAGSCSRDFVEATAAVGAEAWYGTAIGAALLAGKEWVCAAAASF